jgi:hypothetical protein
VVAASAKVAAAVDLAKVVVDLVRAAAADLAKAVVVVDLVKAAVAVAWVWVAKQSVWTILFMLWQCKVLCLGLVAPHFKVVAAEIWAAKVAATWVAVALGKAAADLAKVAADLAKVAADLAKVVADLVKVAVGLVAKVDSVMATMAYN